MGDKTKGLYSKFRVERTDSTDAPGEKHEGCEYFVLDLIHDRHAVKALQAYAASAREDGYGLLASDLDAKADTLSKITQRTKADPKRHWNADEQERWT